MHKQKSTNKIKPILKKTVKMYDQRKHKEMKHILKYTVNAQFKKHYILKPISFT